MNRPSSQFVMEPSRDIIGAMAVCKRVIYTGQVQGVGFRYTVQRLAGGLPVAGYVRNLADGSVELVAEGDEPAVDGLLGQVARQFGRYIVNADVSTQPLQGLRGFSIRY